MTEIIEEKKLSKSEKEKIHKEGIDRFELVRRDPQKKKQKDDLLFLADEKGQWEESFREKRKDRPRCTIDRISGPKDQVIGNQRQTRRGVIVVPQNGGRGEDVTKVAELASFIPKTAQEKMAERIASNTIKEVDVTTILTLRFETQEGFSLPTPSFSFSSNN